MRVLSISSVRYQKMCKMWLGGILPGDTATPHEYLSICTGHQVLPGKGVCMYLPSCHYLPVIYRA